MINAEDLTALLRDAEEWVNVPMQASDAAGLRERLLTAIDDLTRPPVAWQRRYLGDGSRAPEAWEQPTQGPPPRFYFEHPAWEMRGLFVPGKVIP